MTIISRLFLPLFFFITTLLTSCSDETTDITTNTLPAIESYTETGDLSAIKEHGQLRILVMPMDERWLPRKGSSFSSEQEMAIKLAEQLGLEPVFVHVEKFENLIPELKKGHGDLIAANLTITSSRKEQVNFTVPLEHSIERIVSRIDDKKTGTLKSLNGRTIAYREKSSYQETVEKLQEKQPLIKSKILPGHLSTDQIIDQLVSKQIDLAVMDSNILGILAGYRDDFKVSLALSEDRALAWAIRKDNLELLKAINQFLTHQQLTTRHESIFTDDFDGIKKRKTLRVITRNNAASYFLWRGELLGFEYELVKNFAKQHKLRLEIISAPSHEAQIPMLLEGKGDIIASFLTVTDIRKKRGIAFSRAHHKTSEIIVSRLNDNTIESVDDLAGRSIYVRKSSAYWETLQALQNTGLKFNLLSAPETMETEEIIAQVASGEFDLTLADNHLVDIELTWRDDIQAALVLGDVRNNAWAMRDNNPKLITAVDQYIKKQYKSLFYNITYDKYFKNKHKIKKYRSQRIDLNPDGTLSPYDSLIKKYAQKHDFDWRMIIAQMYQESRFNPKAKSWAGARGLMQVMPRTAKEMGISNLKDPELGIKAGVQYLNWVRDRFEEELNVKDRMWFTLAAYNAGQGHVKDARRLARQQGLNPNKWFDNVEKAMLLLSKKKYYKKSRHGYVRGREPVAYVREIRNRYQAYITLIANET
ncbi:MAG: membrane-bound lytic murein transglycosylase MltF [endosymbiont of Galathealinum brachiosum]|uniref:Membrane-bound lytic murein transglycosylase MltF n=1 Tax=endosymbiont of Galathealinum brachiosum TaxID=2200906 RepID=A0A370DFC0_9GAMM|nr:MAG: membrane-bound lytic murein transglycosylase MltF [endosymbiont of Galathealinum brachiosum]